MRTSDRRARALVSVLAATLTLMTVITPAAAAVPQDVAIVSPMTFNDPGPNTGTFTTSGNATESGLICPSGTVVDTRYVVGGFQSGHKVQILVLKDFTCDDDSGTFLVKIQVHAAFDGTESFTWVVQGGTDAYEHLRGSGDGSTVGNPDPSTGNTNYYVGFVIG